MANELRLALFILIAVAIGALLLHGLWTVRKNSGQKQHRYYPGKDQQSEQADRVDDGFDEFGVGKVRVIRKGGAATEESVPSEQVSQEPEISQNQFDFQMPKEPELNFSAIDADDTDEAAKPTTRFSESEGIEEAAPAAPSEVLILYVLLPEGREIKGQDLLPLLLTLGFKFGEMDIFHRHEDSAGSGEVLFSLANMFNPGTFDIEQMEKVSTRGISLFMTMPGPGAPLQNFNLMNNAAKKIAEEFGGQVLDGQRSVLTVQTVRHYVEKIREFQRQQLIRGSR
ncbi:cell division protein ZipA [Alkalimonas collagenimarina]|uniref:Cell division protein ZipA n=1 Tax=Alkalimonas collagenimarina TaxID=400390 RepID=A0ABT9GUE9_9GAMM|nr:cell division protein ZipA [Alkalimonas collagenimarina]MDP4534678.1 cell division protein ZipA [Alkalimonas collagenimarina]